MEMVRIYHPTFEDNRIVEVQEISLEHWLRAGWLKDDERPPLEQLASLPAKELNDSAEATEEGGLK